MRSLVNRALAGAAAVLVVTGCSNSAAQTADRGVEPTTSTATADSRVVIPGEPGDPATVVEPGEPVDVTDEGYSEIDVRFVEQMIPHHRQAIEMAELAPDRASDDRVLLLAERIAAAQQPEIVSLEGWLEARDLPLPDPEASAGHGHGDMPGMISPLQMSTLEESSGAAFDELFLTFMIAHHEGAIEMAAPVAVDGVDILAREMAADVGVTQQTEIIRMREILDES
jgi:uncharacterized protein (DUF305 family)